MKYIKAIIIMIHIIYSGKLSSANFDSGATESVHRSLRWGHECSGDIEPLRAWPDAAVVVSHAAEAECSHLRPELPALLPAQCCSLQEVSAADEHPRPEEAGGGNQRNDRAH